MICLCQLISVHYCSLLLQDGTIKTFANAYFPLSGCLFDFLIVLLKTLSRSNVRLYGSTRPAANCTFLGGNTLFCYKCLSRTQ